MIYTNAYIGYIGGLQFAIARVVARSIVSTFEHESKNGRDEQPVVIAPVVLRRQARVEPRRDTPPPHRGSPVLSHPATVPPQMPLRRVVSHSETISALSQYRTLTGPLEAVYGPYSTSAPWRATRA